MDCPRCHTPLRGGYRQHICVDYCPSCGGVWLERGELDLILARFTRRLNERPSLGVRIRAALREVLHSTGPRK